MAYYVIKTHYEATDKNTNRAGEKHDWYSGKGGAHVGRQNSFPSLLEINTYGYTTLAAAKRGLRAAQENADFETKLGWWKVTAELIEC